MPDVVAANLSGISEVLTNAGGGVLRAPIHQKLTNLNYTNIATIGAADIEWGRLDGSGCNPAVR